MAGFGYSQPTVASAEMDNENARAGALSKIKGDVETEAVPIEMQAINSRMQSGAQEANDMGNFGRLNLSAASQYNPNTLYGEAAQQGAQEAANSGSLFGKIVKSGLGIGTSLLNPESTFGKIFAGASK